MKRSVGVLTVCSTVLCAMPMVAQTVTPAPHQTAPMLPAAYAEAISTSTSGAGDVTLIDATGDSVYRAAPLTVSPWGFTLDANGIYANTVNSNGTMNYFPANANLSSQAVFYDTLPDACTSEVFSPNPEFFTLDVKTRSIYAGIGGNNKGLFSLAAQGTLPQTPMNMTGIAGSHRYMITSQNVPYGVACNNIPSEVPNLGTVTVFDSTTGTQTGLVTVGHCPVYGVTSADGHRSFILNRGDDTVSVINVDTGTLDQTLTIPNTTGKSAQPVFAEYVSRTSKLVVANYGNDTVSIFDVGLDNTKADGPAFSAGKSWSVDLWNGATHTSGKHPAGLAVLPDGSRAYVANQEQGTVDVIDLRLNDVVSTLAVNAGGSANLHPRSVVATVPASTNGVWGKVYVAAPDGPEIPYINVEQNAIDSLSCTAGGLCSNTGGNITDVRVSSDVTTVVGTHLFSSRLPGAGQPCNLPNFNPANLIVCQSH